MSRAYVRRLKEEYPKGTRIELELTNDPSAPVEPGTRGTVVNVDDMGQIHMQWDNGRTLALEPTEDDFRKLTLEEIMQEQNNISEPPVVEENIYIIEKFDNAGNVKFIAGFFDKHESIQLMNEAWNNTPENEKSNTTFKTSTKTVDVPYGASTKEKIAKLDAEQTDRSWTKGAQPLAECSLTHTESCKMLVVPPGNTPYDAYVYDSLEALQGMVDGCIECTYPFEDNAFIIGNDEARINGMQGNRRINGNIYAGTILVAADDGIGGTKDLTDEQVKEYAGKLWQPEDISPAEVADVHYSYQTFNSDKEFFAALGFDM